MLVMNKLEMEHQLKNKLHFPKENKSKQNKGKSFFNFGKIIMHK